MLEFAKSDVKAQTASSMVEFLRSVALHVFLDPHLSYPSCVVVLIATRMFLSRGALACRTDLVGCHID